MELLIGLFILIGFFGLIHEIDEIAIKGRDEDEKAERERVIRKKEHKKMKLKLRVDKESVLKLFDD